MEKALSTVGINFITGGRKYDKVLRIFSLTIVSLASFQSLMYLLTANAFDTQIAGAFIICLFSFQGAVKFAVILKSFDKITEVKRELADLFITLKVESKKENVIQLESFRKFTKLTVVGNLTCIWFFHFKPLVEIIFSAGAGVKTLPFAFYFPVQGIQVDHYMSLYLYEILAGHILTILPLITDGLVMLMVGQVVILFKTIGEAFEELINDYEGSIHSISIERLIQTIDLHNKVLDLSSKLFKIYEYALLVIALLQTGTICFIAFIISVG